MQRAFRGGNIGGVVGLGGATLRKVHAVQPSAITFAAVRTDRPLNAGTPPDEGIGLPSSRVTRLRPPHVAV